MLLWAIVLLSQHFDTMGDSSRAIELIDEAISHTPTDMQLYMVKAKFYKVEDILCWNFFFVILSGLGKKR